MFKINIAEKKMAEKVLQVKVKYIIIIVIILLIFKQYPLKWFL